jgi:hypothetical protein
MEHRRVLALFSALIALPSVACASGPSAPRSTASSHNAKATPATSAAGRGQLSVACSPACDAVLVDGRSLGPTPIARADVPAGTLTVVLRRTGQTQRQMSVVVKDGQLTALQVQMDPAPAPAAAPPPEVATKISHRAVGAEGWVTVACAPACDDVTLDGTKSLGPGPHVSLPLAAGTHALHFKRKGVAEVVRKVEVVAGQTTALRVDMDGRAAPASDKVIKAPVDPQEAAMRKMLEPKAWSGKASADEIRLLKSICAHQGDLACRDRAEALLSKKP